MTWGRVVRAAFTTVAWSLLVLAIAATASRWVDIAAWPLVMVQSLSPLAAPVALVALGGVLLPIRLFGRVALAGSCLVVLAIHAAIWLPWVVDEQPSRGRELTVMTVSLLHGRGDMEKVSDQVRSDGVDLLVLTEVRNAAVANLQAAGIHHQLPHTVPGTPSGAGTVIRSRLPLTPLPTHTDASSAVSPRSPAASLQLGGRLTLRAVHPLPPVRTHVHPWRRTLSDLATWARGTEGALIMAGDFNASVDHPGMRELLGTGLRDAHEVAGAGRPPTWPNNRSVPPFVHIDHVLVRGLEVRSMEEIPIPGTDHVAVLGRLVVPTVT